MKTLTNVLILIIFSALLAGCSFSAIQQGPAQSTENKKNIPETTPELMQQINKAYTLDEIALHNNQEDCWMVIENMVYDVSSYISAQKHPGGEAILMGCGKDATELFINRPNDKGEHSERARLMLYQYQVGLLAK